MKKTIMSLAVVSALFSAGAMAALSADGKADNSASTATLNFTGKVTSSQCQVSTDDITKTIELGEISSAQLKATGGRGPSKSFNVKLVNCDTAVNDISYVIRDGNGSSAQGQTTSDYLIPEMNDLSAKGVGVYIVDNLDAAVQVGSTKHYGVIGDGEGHALSEQTISLGAYIGTQTGVTADKVEAGTVNATGVMTIKATAPAMG
ncbi:fimbrial protein [Escherichia coli]|uniref:fimbrial protein n=1 Tax=Escherichia coli TaxID=562 RepID=UPI000944173D|nr:fimbrial protein [Escherichia coli]